MQDKGKQQERTTKHLRNRHIKTKRSILYMIYCRKAADFFEKQPATRKRTIWEACAAAYITGSPPNDSPYKSFILSRTAKKFVSTVGVFFRRTLQPLPLVTEIDGRGVRADGSNWTVPKAIGSTQHETARYIRQFGLRVQCLQNDHSTRHWVSQLLLPHRNGSWRTVLRRQGGQLVPP